MTLLLDVLQIIARDPICRIFLAHVTKTAGKFGESLTISAFAEPADLQVIGFEKNRTGKEGYDRFGIEQGGFSARKIMTTGYERWAERLGAASLAASETFRGAES